MTQANQTEERRYETSEKEGPRPSKDIIERLQNISFSLAMGGSNVTDAAKLLDRIEEGLDHILRVEAGRSADVIEELSKRAYSGERITWGEIKRAVLARAGSDAPERAQNTMEGGPNG